MTQNQKSVGLAVLVVVAVLIAIVVLINVCASSPPDQQAPEPAAGAAAQAAPKLPVVIDDKQRERLRQAAAARKAAQVAAQQQGQLAPRKAGGPVARMPGEDTIDSRSKFAEELGQRFQKRGQRVEVSVAGDEGRVFQVRWAQRRPDRRHMLSLQKATPFHQELRGRGFKKLELKTGERTVWEQEL